jgi:hypothetical protein
VKVTLGERIKSFGMFPDIGKLQGMFDEKFNALLTELQSMHGVLNDILAELRTQRGAPQ